MDTEERTVPWTAAAAARLDRLAQAVPVIAREPMTEELLARMSGSTGIAPLSAEQVAALRHGPAPDVDEQHLTGLTSVYLLDAEYLWNELRAADLDAELAAMAQLHQRGAVLHPCTRWGRPPRPTVLLHMIETAREIDKLPDNEDGDRETDPRPRRRWTRVVGRLLRRHTATARAV
ncbi:MAG TPA: hypothetical protein VL551_11705 [Actinospica sp.]|jgi:hypothetical protein|nr:hypothetical protein [Actinospica sp.]